MPTNPPKHHDFNHQTPTKSNTKIWLQDSNKELELTERKRKKCSKVRKKGSCARHVHGKPIKQQANLKLRATQELKQPKENDPCHPGCNPYVKTHTKISDKDSLRIWKEKFHNFLLFFSSNFRIKYQLNELGKTPIPFVSWAMTTQNSSTGVYRQYLS